MIFSFVSGQLMRAEEVVFKTWIAVSAHQSVRLSSLRQMCTLRDTRNVIHCTMHYSANSQPQKLIKAVWAFIKSILIFYIFFLCFNTLML